MSEKYDVVRSLVVLLFQNLQRKNSPAHRASSVNVTCHTPPSWFCIMHKVSVSSLLWNWSPVNEALMLSKGLI